MDAIVLPGGLRNVPCESQVSKLVKQGKQMGGAEGESQKRQAQLVKEEYRQTQYSKVMIDPGMPISK